MIPQLTLPDWVPWWVHLVILVALLSIVITFALMPFSVFGTKSRLEAIDSRLDEIQAEIRSLVLRLPEIVADDDRESVRPQSRSRGWLPPIPPPPSQPRHESARPMRTEPKL